MPEGRSLSLHVLHVLCDLSAGGAERLVLELCRRRAPDITVAVATVHGLGPLEGAFREAGIPVMAAGRQRRHPGLRAVARLAGRMRGFDVVHTHLFAGDTWGRLAASLAHIPVVVTTEHNVNREETWQRPVKRALASRSSAIVCVSAAVAAYTRTVDRIGREDPGSTQAPLVRIIHNGIDPGRFGPHPGGAGTRILALGRRVPQKGFDVLIDALPDGMTLTVAGEGPFHVDHPRVEWLGRREDVPALLAGADILAVPSRWEGFGLAAAEGLAAGVAVVASDVDGLAEVLGDAGLRVPPADVGALREALIRLRDDAPLRRALGERGPRRAAEHFDIRDTVRRYEALYRELSMRAPPITDP